MTRRSYFYHDPMTTAEADELISRYTSRNVPTIKTLSADPRLWVVGALLPYSQNEPRPQKQYRNRIWQ